MVCVVGSLGQKSNHDVCHMVDICHAAKNIPYRLQMQAIVRMYITHS